MVMVKSHWYQCTNVMVKSNSTIQYNTMVVVKILSVHNSRVGVLFIKMYAKLSDE